jgi:hypothetical protein
MAALNGGSHQKLSDYQTAFLRLKNGVHIYID